MKVSLFSYVVSAALLFATTAIANNPVENDTISSKKTALPKHSNMEKI